jgi:hypothetical protein
MGKNVSAIIYCMEKPDKVMQACNSCINEGSPSTDCSRAQLLHAWEISRIPHFCDADQGTLIPDYFDLTFKQDLESYVNAIAEHFAKFQLKIACFTFE